MNNLLRDGESEPDTLCISTSWALKEAKKFEQLFLIILTNPNTSILYLYLNEISLLFLYNTDNKSHITVLGEFESIGL